MAYNRLRAALIGGTAAVTLAFTSAGLLAPSAAAAPPRSIVANAAVISDGMQLPANDLTGIAVDDVGKHILVSVESAGEIVVANLDGSSAGRTIGGLVNPANIVVAGNATAYVADWGNESIGIIDLTTLTLTELLPIPSGQLLNDITFTGGKLWYSYTDPGSTTGGFAVYDPAAGPSAPFSVGFVPSIIRANADRPDRVVLSDGNHTAVYDLSGPAPSLVSEADVRLASDAAFVLGTGQISRNGRLCLRHVESSHQYARCRSHRLGMGGSIIPGRQDRCVGWRAGQREQRDFHRRRGGRSARHGGSRDRVRRQRLPGGEDRVDRLGFTYLRH